MTIELYLHGQGEKVVPEEQNVYNIRPGLLYHQWRTVQALKTSPLVMNVYNTGTGKTQASLLHLFDIPNQRDNHVLIIAPTNELLHQHVGDVQEFVSIHKLPFRVVEINAALLRQLASPDLAIVNRQGERLTRLVRNPLEFKEQLGIPEGDSRPMPTIFVTNPDLFYYAFFWQFNANDQRNLFEEFVLKFRYIVIDEFHYYNSKQLANFLFFIILSKEWGYFEMQDRRICLLSATPDDATRQFLDRIFPDGQWALVAPDNEPPGAADLPQVATLAPLHLRLQPGTLDDFAKEEAQTVKQWLDDGEDGAMISSALWRVNNAHAALLRAVPHETIGRITGAQPLAERRQDQHKRLILATPTVDIGYNFIKQDKSRQNLDFVVFDARFRDEFIQRLGRAGRVLGKEQTNVPAHAVALLDTEAISKLAPLQGTSISRSELKDHLEKLNAIPSKDDFVAYIKSGGLLENTYPLYRLSPMFAKEEESQLRRLFDAVQEVFAPSSRMTFDTIFGCYRRADAINAWLGRNEYNKKWLNPLMEEFLGWVTAESVSTDVVELQIAPQLEQDELADVRKSFRLYCEMKQALQRAQFSFRDSFSGPVATIFDPQRLLSSSITTQYDLIHVVQNYHYTPLTPEQYRTKTDGMVSQNTICIQIDRPRQPRQHITLTWQTRHTLPKLRWEPWDVASFRRCFASGEPIAIKGLVINAEEPLPAELRLALTEQYVPALLIPNEKRGILYRALAQRPAYPYKLSVRVEEQVLEFEAILGTNALLMSPILWWVFQVEQRKEETAIIC